MEQWADELSRRGFATPLGALSTNQQSPRAASPSTKDIDVPKARIKDAVAKVKRTTRANISASFTTAKAKINILATSSATIRRGIGLTASTFRLTGGGSASLNVKEAFIVQANGGHFIAIRRGSSAFQSRAWLLSHRTQRWAGWGGRTGRMAQGH